jgi:hypothetical protein
MRILVLFILIPVISAAQDNAIDLDQMSDTYVATEDADSETSQDLENYMQLLAHRLDLNSASDDQLRAINFSSTQITNLTRHIRENGKLLSIYELQSINGFDTEFIRMIQRMATVRNPEDIINRSLLERVKADGDNYLLLRYDHTLEKRQGFIGSPDKPAAFRGRPGRISWRLRSQRPGDFSFGITAEKDPGEAFKWSPSQYYYGFDYIALHAQVQNKKMIKNLIVGDFQGQFGQGLVWGGNLGFGKGAETITSPRRANVGFIPYTSAYEAGNYRGIAATVAPHENITISGILSATRRDASLKEVNDIETITSLQTSGLHRTEQELERRKSVNESVSGLVFQYQKKDLTLGATCQYIDYGAPVEPRMYLYNKYAFRGNTNTNAGIYGYYNIHNAALFWESATTIGKGSAITAGGLFSLTRRLDFAISFRNFTPDYQGLYSSPFAEGTKAQNERGTYWGFRYTFNRRFSTAGYVDFFQFKSLKFRVYAPSTGQEWLLRFQWQPSKLVSAFVQGRHETKMRNISSDSRNLYSVGDTKKQNYWFNIEYGGTPAFKMKTRIQYNIFEFNSKRTEGFALMQDASWSWRKFRFTGRYALFETDNYDNRLYVYEHDVWLAYSLPAYYGRGTRRYLMMQFKASKKYTFWLRYSNTRYADREFIGSGVEKINSNQQNDIKFEMRIRF